MAYGHAAEARRDAVLLEGKDAVVYVLGRVATLEDVGNVAAFVASDRARTITAATANISCGTLIDY